MIPVGYLAKRIELKPDWLKTDQVEDIYSLSNCVSKDFADYIEHWKHNGYWLFNSNDDNLSLAKDLDIDMSGTKIFYYEAYEYQCYEDEAEWEEFQPDESLETNVIIPEKKVLEGFDVVSIYNENSLGCSYLSCNHMAQELKVNKHCLFSTFEEAKTHLDNNVFNGCEPGPCRIFAVYSVRDA